MVDADGNDWSNDIVQYDGGVLIIVLYDVKKLSIEDAEKIKNIHEIAVDLDKEIVILNSNVSDVYNSYKTKLMLPDMEVYNSDDTDLKAAIRSNPGLIIIKDAVVYSKYHINDFPNKEEIKHILK